MSQFSKAPHKSFIFAFICDLFLRALFGLFITNVRVFSCGFLSITLFFQFDPLRLSALTRSLSSCCSRGKDPFVKATSIVGDGRISLFIEESSIFSFSSALLTHDSLRIS